MNFEAIPFFKSIRGKVLLSIIIPGAILLTAVISYLSYNEYYTTKKSEEIKLKRISDRIALEVEEAYTNGVLVTKVMALAQENGMFGNREQSLNLAQKVLANLPEFTGAYFGYEPDADGQDFSYSLGSNALSMKKAVNKKGRFIPYWFRDHNDNSEILLTPLVDMETSLYYDGVRKLFETEKVAKPIITEPYVYEGKMIVEQTYPITRKNKFLGIAGVDRALTDINNFLEDISKKDHVEIFLISKTGKFVASTVAHSKDLLTKGIEQTKYNEIFDEFYKERQKQLINLATDPFTDESNYFITSYVEGADWLVIVSELESEITSPIINHLITVIIISLVGASIVFFSAFKVINTVSSSLNDAVITAERVATGAFDRAMNFAYNKKDEIGLLFSSFNEMIKQLSDREKSIKESEKRYKLLIASSNTGAWEYNNKTGYLWCSPEYFTMLGRDQKDFNMSGDNNIEETWVNLLHPDDRAKSSKHFADYLSTGSQGMYENRFRMKHADGSWVWIWSRANTLRDDSGKPTILTVGTHIDVTEEMKKDVEQKKLLHDFEERMKELNCLYSLTQLINDRENTLENVLQKTVDLIPPAWQHPVFTRARISFNDEVFESNNFRESEWKQEAPIEIKDKEVGKMEVFYTREMPESDIGPFMNEEQILLEMMSKQLGEYYLKKESEEELRKLHAELEQRIEERTAELKESQEKFQSISAWAKDAIIMMDSNGNVNFWNKAAERIFGWSEEDVYGNDLHKFIAHERYYDDFRKGFNHFLATGEGPLMNKTVEALGMRKDGTEFPAAVSVSGIQLKGKWNAIAILRDITEQKAAEEALKTSEERSRIILESISEGIFGVDVNGKATFINSSALEMLGYEQDEIIGNSIHAITHHTHADGKPYHIEDCPMYKTFTNGEEYEIEDEVLWTKEGTFFPVEYSSKPMYKDGELIGAVISFKDITQKRELERQLKLTQYGIDHAGDPVFWIDLETAKILSSNKTAWEGLGYTKEEFVNMSVSDIDPEFPKEKWEPLVNTIKAGNIASFESKHKRKNGETFPVDVNARYIEFEGMEYMVAFVRDITDRKKAEKEIRESEEQMNFAMDATGEGIWDWKIDENLVSHNKKWCELLDLDLSYISHDMDTFAQFIHEEDRPTVFEKVNKSMETDEMYHSIHRMLKQNGEVFWVEDRGKVVKRDSEGKPLRMVGSMVDITARIINEEQIKKLNSAIEQSPVSVVITDLEGKIEYVNPYFTEVTGYASEEAIGNNPKVLKSGEHDDEFYKDMWNTISSGKTWSGELVNIKKNGEKYWESASISPVISKNGDLTNYVAVKTDITERKKLESEILQQKEILENTLESLSHPFYVIDANTYRILLANSAAKELGLSGESTCHALTHRSETPCDSETDPCPLKMVKETGKPAVVEHIHFDKHGEPKFVEVHGFPVFDKEGNIVQMIEYSLDITDKKEAEESLRQAKLAAEKIVDGTPVPMAVATVADGTILRLNRMMLDFHQIDEEQAKDMKATDWYVDLDDRKHVVEGLEKDGFVDNFNVVFKRFGTGEHRECMCSYSYIHYEGQDCILGSYIDIHDMKEAEREIERINMLSDNALALSNSVFWIYDLEATDKIQFSERGHQIFGLDKTEDDIYTIETWFSGLINANPEIADVTGKLLQDAITNPEIQYDKEYPYKRLDNGEQVWIHAVGEVIREEDGTPLRVLGVAQDITEKKNAEEEIKKNETQLKTLVDTIPGTVYRCRLDENWTMVYISDEVKVLTGYPGSDFLNNKVRTFASIIHPDDSENSSRIVQHAVDSHEPYELEYRVINDKHQEVWVYEKGQAEYNEDGVAEFLDGTVIDISERKKAEEEIKHINFMSDNALDLTKAGFWHIDLKDQEWYTSSERAARIFGDPPSEGHRYKLFEHWAECVKAGDAEAAEKTFEIYAAAVEGTIPRYDATYAYKRPVDGKIVWIRAIGDVVRNEKGEATDMFGVTQDITEQKNAEIEIKEAHEKLDLALKSANMGTWSFDIKGNKLIGDSNTKRLYGLEEVELDGTVEQWFTYIYPDDIADLGAVMQETMSNSIEDYHTEFRVKKQNGDISYIMSIGKFSYDADCNPIEASGLVWDITGIKEAEEELLLSKNRLEALNRISEYEIKDVKEFIDYSLSEALKLTDSKIGYIYLYNEEKKEFTLNTWSGEVMKECNVMDPQTVYQLEKTGLWGEVVRQRKPIIVNDYDIKKHPLSKGYPEGHIQLRTFLSLPIFVENEIVGVIGLGNKDAGYTDNDMQQIGLMMDSMWKIITIHNSKKEVIAAKEAAEYAAEIARLGHWELDLNKQEFIFNEQFYGILGTSAEIEGRDNISARDYLDRFVHPEDKELVLRKVKEAVDSEDGHSDQFEYRVIKADKEIQNAYVKYSVTKTDKIATATGIHLDITERKKAEEELQERLDELERFNRLVVGREIKMIELKEEINEILKNSGKSEKYKIVNDDDFDEEKYNI